MTLIKLEDLLKPKSTQEANEIIDSFFNDRNAYLDQDFYLRKGVCKDIAKLIIEEYAPLVKLAEDLEREYVAEASLRLFQEGNEGPDGEILFSSVIPSCKVQITCAGEGYNRALIREQFANKECVFPNQSRERDKVSKKVVASGGKWEFSPKLFQKRFNRIIDAIRRKETNYYEDTDTLLVVEDPAKFKYLCGLHEKIREAIQNGPDSSYERIYADYGGDLKRVK